MKESTMRDVVARCEEGFAAQITTHQKQMDKITQEYESMRDMKNILEATHQKQLDALSKRDAQIEKLKQDLAAAKSTTTTRATKMPILRQTKTPRSTQHPPFTPTPTSTSPAFIIPTTTSLSSPSSSKVTELQENVNIPTPKKHLHFDLTKKEPAVDTTKVPEPTKPTTMTLHDFTPAISLAVHHISEAISTGLSIKPEEQQQQDQDEDEYDMLDSCLEPSSTIVHRRPMKDISTAISTAFENVITSTISHPQQPVQIPKEAITSALKNAVQYSIRTNFTPIHEAVSFVQPCSVPEYITAASPLEIEHEEEIPVLVIDNDYVIMAKDKAVNTEQEMGISTQEEKAISSTQQEKEISAEEKHIPAEEERPELMSELKQDIPNPTETIPTVELTKETLSPEFIIPDDHVAQVEQELFSEIQEDVSVWNEEEYDSEQLTMDHEPYTYSVNQPSTLSFVFNRWTVVCLVVYIVFQTN